MDGDKPFSQGFTFTAVCKENKQTDFLLKKNTFTVRQCDEEDTLKRHNVMAAEDFQITPLKKYKPTEHIHQRKHKTLPNNVEYEIEKFNDREEILPVPDNAYETVRDWQRRNETERNISQDANSCQPESYKRNLFGNKVGCENQYPTKPKNQLVEQEEFERQTEFRQVPHVQKSPSHIPFFQEPAIRPENVKTCVSSIQDCPYIEYTEKIEPQIETPISRIQKSKWSACDSVISDDPLKGYVSLDSLETPNTSPRCQAAIYKPPCTTSSGSLGNINHQLDNNYLLSPIIGSRLEALSLSFNCIIYIPVIKWHSYGVPL